jgi:hypothetical protein
VSNWRRFLVSFIAVFIAQAMVAGALHMWVIEPFVDDAGLGRPEGEEKIVPYMLSRVLFVALFVWIYARWYVPARQGRPGAQVDELTGRPVGHGGFFVPAQRGNQGREQTASSASARLLSGLRYGFIIWLFYSIPMTVGFWAFLRMPDNLALTWVGIGLAEYVVGGMVVGLIFRAQKIDHLVCK